MPLASAFQSPICPSHVCQYSWSVRPATASGPVAGSPNVAVAPYSDAYFALLRALPELVQPAALEPAVLVAGARVSIKIQEGGKTAWDTGELEGIVRGFRG